MRFFFGFLHNCVAHPLMFWTGYSLLSSDFHDYTARMAWPEEHQDE